MATGKEYSVEEWRALAIQQREKIGKLKEQYSYLEHRYTDNQIRMSLNETGAKADVEKDKAAMSAVQDDIQATNALLGVIPTRLDIAYGRVFERQAEQVEKILPAMADLAKKIDEAAEAFVLALKPYIELTHDLDEIARVKSIEYPSEMLAIKHFCEVHGVKMRRANFMPNDELKSFSEAVSVLDETNHNTFLRSTKTYLDRLHKVAKILKREAPGKGCECGGEFNRLNPEAYDGKGSFICSACGKTSDGPVYS